MNIQKIHRGANAPLRSRVILALVGFMSLILTACGGTGDESTKTTSASTEEERKQALAVPGTWTGRAPKYEVINGITVPPEPAPALNNATLAGVDINNNGVRDDVERVIARQSSNFSGSIDIAKEYQRFFAIGPSLTRADALLLYSSLTCAMQRAGVTSYGASTNNLRDNIFNTANRLNILNRVFAAIDGGFSGEELASC